ncbi:MAG: HD domain-containing protein [Desulfovibrionales bacterium]
MPNIRKSLLQFVFSGSFMKRWNDKLRPMELVEVDKQAHKMIIAWILFQLNSKHLSREEKISLGEKIIEGGIFDYFYRLIITDIKPPVFYRIKKNPDHYKQLTSWVLDQLQPRLQPLGKEFFTRLTAYVQEPDAKGPDREILSAAHMFASSWEFNLIRGLALWDEEMEEIESAFAQGLQEYSHLEGMPQITAGPQTPLGRFAHLCGQLRFQKRWSQTPRIPETSVLGHMFLVACYAYFFSLSVGGCRRRSQNNFFAGLFHDLPELLTRDIISPVKKSVQPIGDLIKEYEDQEIQHRVFNLLRSGGYDRIAEDLAYFLGIEVGSEFDSTIRTKTGIKKVDWEELQNDFNEDGFDPKDGKLLKVCDSLAAFIEAYTAMRNGITTDQLQLAVMRIRTDYSRVSLGEGLHIGALLADFD